MSVEPGTNIPELNFERHFIKGTSLRTCAKATTDNFLMRVEYAKRILRYAHYIAPNSPSKTIVNDALAELEKFA